MIDYDETDVCTCGHHRCTGILSWDIDPFRDEINDDQSLYWDCEGGRHESAMDI